MHTTSVCPSGPSFCQMDRAVPAPRFGGLQALEIKRMSAAMAAVKSEVSKLDERLEEARRYRAFLDSVTPDEWFQAIGHTWSCLPCRTGHCVPV
jgi:hypothetical protein